MSGVDMVRIRDNIAADMEDIVGMFKPGARIAVLVRLPGQPVSDFISTTDDIDELIAMLERRKARDLEARNRALDLARAM